MLEVLMTILRDRETSPRDFRHAVAKVASHLALQASAYLKKETIQVQTPIATTQGAIFRQNLILIPVLRSGIALLPAFIDFFPDASVGFIGIRRDETTAAPHVYYTQFPPMNAENLIFILEPMLATGGSSMAAIKSLIAQGAAESQILLISVIAAPEGLQEVYFHFPKVQFLNAHIDESLNDRKFIIPGLGDFGDRYFGTVGNAHENFS